MNQVKKSFNMPEALSNRIERFVEANPGTNFTFVVVQALENWLKNPQVYLSSPDSGGRDEKVARPSFGQIGRGNPAREL